MYIRLSIEVYCITSIILLFLLYKAKTSSYQQVNIMLFEKLSLSVSGILLLEIVSLVLNGRSGFASYCLLNVTAVLQISLSGFASYYWLMYTLCEDEALQKWLFHKRHNLILEIPAFVLLLITLASPWTGHVFHVDTATHQVQRGTWYVLQLAVTYGFFTAASGRALYLLLCRFGEQRHIVTKALVVLLPGLAGLVHLAFPDISAVWPTVTLLLMMEFCDFQDDQISSDSLTTLNNRRNFDVYLDSLLKDGDCAGVYLFMLDIDYFKQINDTYGHVEGDLALVKTATILKTVCASRNLFLARYGGDEFAIVATSLAEEDARALKTAIEAAFASEEAHVVDGKPYRIKISVGYAAAEHGSHAALELIRRADAVLYEEKSRNHRLAHTERSGGE